MATLNANEIKISAVLPNYNSSEFLTKSIQSLINQTEPFTEIIIVDDGSTDESLTIIADFMAKYDHVRLIKHTANLGVCLALNHGLEQAIGDYVILCAADDWYHENIVALAKQVIQQFPTVGLICGDALVDRYDLAAQFRRTLPFPSNELITPQAFKLITQKSYVGFNGSGGMFMNRQAIMKAGLLYPELKWHCDWMLYFVIAFQQGIYYLDNVFVYISMRKESYSQGKQVWQEQKQVMLDTINILAKDYPDLWYDFKKAALLPSYEIRYIPLFLFHSKMRRFLSVPLLWKLIINNAFVTRIGRLFPYRIILGVRKLLRS
jgi:glycosyltransferase involved in cell wall biosynthesis